MSGNSKRYGFRFVSRAKRAAQSEEQKREREKPDSERDKTDDLEKAEAQSRSVFECEPADKHSQNEHETKTSEITEKISAAEYLRVCGCLDETRAQLAEVKTRYNQIRAESEALLDKLRSTESLLAEALRRTQKSGEELYADAAAILSDPGFIKTYALSRPELKAAVISGYFDTLPDAPPAMPAGRGAGTVTALKPAKDLKEAKRQASLLLGGEKF